MKIIKTKAAAQGELTEEERDLLNRYRALDETGKDYVWIMVKIAGEQSIKYSNLIDFPRPAAK